jgi:hypothetical protein
MSGYHFDKKRKLLVDATGYPVNMMSVVADATKGVGAVLPIGGGISGGAGGADPAAVEKLKATVELISSLEVNVRDDDYGAAGDGVNDDTGAIQDAINFVNTQGGGVVVVPEGTYLVNGLELMPNVHLKGYGATLVGLSTTSYIISLQYGDNMTIEGFTFDGSQLSLGAAGRYSIYAQNNPWDSTTYPNAILYANIKVLNNRFRGGGFVTRETNTNQTYHSAFMWACDVLFDGNYSENSGGDHFAFNAGYNRVTNNTVINGADGGIAFNFNARGVITGNRIINAHLGIGAGGEDVSTFATSMRNQMIVEDNYIESCAYGVLFGWFDWKDASNNNYMGPTNFVINGNTFRNNYYDGIQYQGGPTNVGGGPICNGVISNNTFEGSGWDGTLTNSAGDGQDIRVQECSNIVISGNIMTNNKGGTKWGIRLRNVKQAHVVGNHITGYDGANDYDYGIALEGTSYSTVSNNYMSFIRRGVYSFKNATSSASSNYNVISNNDMKNMGIVGIQFINGFVHVKCDNNNIESGAAITGIWLNSGAEGSLWFTICHNNFLLAEGGGTAILIDAAAHDKYKIVGNTTYGSAVTDNGTGTNKQVEVNWGGTQRNFVNIMGAATGSRPTINALGPDTHVDLQLNSKGFGKVYFNPGIWRTQGAESCYASNQAISASTSNQFLNWAAADIGTSTGNKLYYDSANVKWINETGRSMNLYVRITMEFAPVISAGWLEIYDQVSNNNSATRVSWNQPAIVADDATNRMNISVSTSGILTIPAGNYMQARLQSTAAFNVKNFRWQIVEIIGN